MKNKNGLPDMITFDTRSAFEKLLACSISDEKAKDVTERLLERYGSLATVFSESEEELCRVGGINMNTALLIKLVAYVNSRRVTEKFEYGRVPTELELRELIVALFLGASVETVYAILLDESGKTISVEYISDGTVNASDILPRKILEYAKKKKAKEIIIAHNHPKGRATPSKDDILTTGRLVALFASVGMRLRAHYVVADGEIERIEAEMLYNPEYSM